MQATVELLDLKPAAIEHIDRPLFDQTKGQLQFQAARDLLELDTQPCESILIVEFYDDDVAQVTNLPHIGNVRSDCRSCNREKSVCAQRSSPIPRR